tara:strand:+ start:969 stop:1292 length:324 start_codon:yes stop_codon:yes gene_type:complete
MKFTITRFLAALTILLLISACTEKRYDAHDSKTQIDSFVELLYATPENQRKIFFELYVFYTLPYTNELGKIVTEDIHNLDGLTAGEVMQVISDHYDMVDYRSQHEFQ